MITIKDTQIAIRDYQKSLTLEGYSIPNGQPAILKSYISQLQPYLTEILDLPEDTLLDQLNPIYRPVVYNIQSYLPQISIPVEEFNLTLKPLDPFNAYRFNYIYSSNNSYVFSLEKVPDFIRNKLSISQRANIYSMKDNKYLSTGIITDINTLNFTVTVKNTVSLSDIGYSQIDNYWGAQDYVSTWIKDDCFTLSSMSSWIMIKLYTVKILYNCVWNLYYQENNLAESILVAKGTDNIQPGYAYLSKDKVVFKPGLYTIKSKLIKYGMYSTNYKELKWELVYPRNFLKND